MEENLIDLLRKSCEAARTMTDEEINQIESDLWLFSTKPFLRVRNKIDLDDLRKKWMVGDWRPGLHVTDIEHNRLHDCERMFIDCLYGPCCVWARATMEHILQIDCLSDPNVPEDFKNKIYKGRNPSLEKMKKELKMALEKGYHSWSDEESDLCEIIANNGDYTVHIRLDKISGGKTAKDYLREWGHSSEEIKTIQINEQDFIEMNAKEEVRKMAIESMRCLYRMFTLRRAP
jgi:hypothetical protein